MTINKRLAAAIIGFAVAVAIFFVWNWKFRIQYESTEFVGQIQRVENNIIFVQGLFIVDKHPELLTEDNQKEAEILILPETEFIKTSIYLPTLEELEKTQGYYTADDLRREDLPGQLSDLSGEDAEGLSVTVITIDNVYKKSVFSASKIKYTVPVIPE